MTLSSFIYHNASAGVLDNKRSNRRLSISLSASFFTAAAETVLAWAEAGIFNLIFPVHGVRHVQKSVAGD
jgi:hypothetical protein